MKKSLRFLPQTLIKTVSKQGSPSRTRTYNKPVNSRLLYH